MANGYNGKVLRVNLTSGTTVAEPLEEKLLRQYLGGAGLVTYFLTKEVKAGIDALSPDNKLFLMNGPLTGQPLSGSGRNCVGCKSPLTGGIAKSEVGGFWGAELQHAGFDGIIVEGKAAKPTYLWIKDGEAQLKDATKLWGQPTKETETAIRAELGDARIRVASIGPGGENLVRFACVMNDLKEAAGRGGTGAVMGSKNLKAIAVRGTKPTEIAKPDALAENRQWLMDNKKLWESNATYGTGAPAQMEAGVPQGNLPIRNFRDGEFPGVSKITAGSVKDQVRIGMEGCYACVVRCKKVVKIDEPGMKVDPEYGGPEYEALASLGSTCGVEDLKAICKANELCNAYSLDAISVGTAIGFAMECYERGILTSKDTGGLDLKFGNAKSMVQAVELIARRQGIGDLIAEGVKRMSERLGKGTSDFAMHVKGLEFPMHDPRAKAVLGVGYAVNPHGADHCMNLHDAAMTAPNPNLNSLHPVGIHDPLNTYDLSPKKVDMFRYFQSYRLIQDCAVTCMFVPYNLERTVELIKSATGWDTGMVEMLKVAQRVLTLARVYNMREGLTVDDDVLPKRVYQQHVGGASEKNPPYEKVKMDRAKGYYYSLMGWDKNGVPTQDTLEMLDIAWAATK